MTILLTGATGFIGSSLAKLLYKEGYSLIAGVRKSAVLPVNIQQVVTGEMLPTNNWLEALSGVEVVIHLAARVHIMDDTSSDPLFDFRNVNTAATLNLAQQAAQSGVRRFIFLSTIKVNGEFTRTGHPFTAESLTVFNSSYSSLSLKGIGQVIDKGINDKSLDAYALSKFEAEQGLLRIAQKTGMEVVIIRPPLVYGMGVKGNFNSLINMINKGLPIPAGSINNKRSFVALPNLIDLIAKCINHPCAANQIFLASDGEDLSTTDLILRLGLALNKPVRLIPLNKKLLELALKLIGKSDVAQRLCGNLQVDIIKTRDLLGWSPPFSVDRVLKQTVQAWLEQHKGNNP